MHRFIPASKSIEKMTMATMPPNSFARLDRDPDCIVFRGIGHNVHVVVGTEENPVVCSDGKANGWVEGCGSVTPLESGDSIVVE